MKQGMGPNDPTPTISKTDRSPQEAWPHGARALAGGITDGSQSSAGEGLGSQQGFLTTAKGALALMRALLSGSGNIQRANRM